jgi:O-antigen/teichoic acid export membrane protein
MLKYGLPLSFADIMDRLLTQLYNFVIIFYCSNFLIGNYTAATNFSVMLVFFTFPITTMLFPAFSQLNPEREHENLRIVFQASVKYAALLVVPATTVIMALSEPLILSLYGSGYPYAPLYLTLVAVGYLYTGLGNLSLGNFLNGQGKTTLTLKLTLAKIAVGLPLCLVLIPNFGILGLIATMLVAEIPSLIIGLWWIKEKYGFSIDLLHSAKIYLTSGTAAVITYITLFKLDVNPWAKLITGGIIFTTIYLTFAPLIGAVNKADLNNLKEMFSVIRPIYPLISLPLRVIEKILTMKEAKIHD